MSKNVSGIKLKILCLKFDYPSLHSREGAIKMRKEKPKKNSLFIKYL